MVRTQARLRAKLLIGGWVDNKDKQGNYFTRFFSVKIRVLAAIICFLVVPVFGRFTLRVFLCMPKSLAGKFFCFLNLLET